MNEVYQRELERIKKFFDPLIFGYRVAKEIEKRTDKYLASDFDLIELIKPDENKVSDVMKLLLEPDGKHGQGKLFLRKFLEVLNKKLQERSKGLPGDIENLLDCDTTVEREVESEGRIDIRIDFKEKGRSFLIIGIENKPWADDQTGQLERYSEYLENKSGGNYVLLFISGDGRLPSKHSIREGKRKDLEENGKLVCSSYRGFLLPWLKECLKECEADKVRWFLKDFVSWIEKSFKEVRNDSGRERND